MLGDISTRGEVLIQTVVKKKKKIAGHFLNQLLLLFCGDGKGDCC